MHYLSCVFFIRTVQIIDAAMKIAARGHRFSIVKLSSVISLYPQDAGNILPAIRNSSGRRFSGNMIPDNRMEGRKIRMENMEVLA